MVKAGGGIQVPQVLLDPELPTGGAMDILGGDAQHAQDCQLQRTAERGLWPFFPFVGLGLAVPLVTQIQQDGQVQHGSTYQNDQKEKWMDAFQKEQQNNRKHDSDLL